MRTPAEQGTIIRTLHHNIASDYRSAAFHRSDGNEKKALEREADARKTLLYWVNLVDPGETLLCAYLDAALQTPVPDDSPLIPKE